MGSCGGRVGTLITLGDGATACGDGESAKVRRRGTAGIGRGDWLGLWMAETGGTVGFLADEGGMAGEATLGGALSGTLGRGPECWKVGSRGAMIQRDYADWQWHQVG